MTAPRFTYYSGEDTVQRRDAQTGEETIHRRNGGGGWYPLEIDGFCMSEISAQRAAELLGPEVDLEAPSAGSAAGSAR